MNNPYDHDFTIQPASNSVANLRAAGRTAVEAIDLPGGALRVTLGQQQGSSVPDDASSRPTTYVHAGASRYSFGSESAEAVGGVTKHSIHSEQQAQSQPGSVAATLQKHQGKDTVELQPGVPGSRTSVESALREGLITRLPGGYGYADAATNGAGLNDAGHTATQAAAVAQQVATQVQQDQAAQRADAELFPAEQEQGYAASIASLSQPGYDSAIAGMIASVAHGMPAASVVHALASAEGIELHQAEQHVALGMQRITHAVSAAVAPLGITGDRLQSFFDSAAKQPDQLAQALQQLVHQRDPSAFKAMAKAFDHAVPPAEIAMLKQAGAEVARDPTGGYLVRVGQGGWQSLSAVMKGMGQS